MLGREQGHRPLQLVVEKKNGDLKAAVFHFGVLSETYGLEGELLPEVAAMMPPMIAITAITATTPPLPNLLLLALGEPARTDFETDSEAAGLAGAASAGDAAIETAATAAIYLPRRIE